MKTKKLIKSKHFIFLSLIFFSVFFASPVFAAPKTNVGKPANVGRNITVVPTKVEPTKTLNRLTEGSLRSCQAREDAVKKRARQLGQLAGNMENTFDAIVQRVREYYLTKLVPVGKKAADYDGLDADIVVKKVAVQTALTQAQANTNFSCASDDPKAQMTQFREDMQKVIQALKDYRTSIKNLIVAVNTAK